MKITYIPYSTIFICTLTPAFALDFISAGYPKLGHIIGALIGAIPGVIYLKKQQARDKKITT